VISVSAQEHPVAATTIRIPQTDPKAGFLVQREAIEQAIRRTLDGGRYILGDEVAAFEREFAAFASAGHGIAVANGTDALEVALRALDLPPGSGVVTVSHTAVATVAAIERAGLVPVLADIEAEFYTLAPEALRRALAGDIDGGLGAKPSIRAVIPVHLYGQMAAMDEIAGQARAAGAAIVEDCAQAHGAALGGTPVGGFGAAACYSFYPTKNLGAIGDGGLVATSDAGLAERMRMVREYGWKSRYVSDIKGLNSRLDELQAAILRVKLTRLAAANARRREIARLYDEGLAGAVATPKLRDGAAHVYHQYVVRVAKAAREEIRGRIADRGVGTLIHYPVPVHLQPAYRGRIWLAGGALPATERAADEVLSLPMYPEMTDAAVAETVAAVKAAVT
jgi:dTDP-4-amino-4,6-dideoxygalactose transaminase